MAVARDRRSRRSAARPALDRVSVVRFPAPLSAVSLTRISDSFSFLQPDAHASAAPARAAASRLARLHWHPPVAAGGQSGRLVPPGARTKAATTPPATTTPIAVQNHHFV